MKNTISFIYYNNLQSYNHKVKIKWNEVTWYSKIIALAMFIIFPIIAFYLGIQYEKSANPKEISAITYSNPCKLGEVALFEGGFFSSCQKSSEGNKINTPNSHINANSTAPTATPSNTASKTYLNPCPNGEVALYEGEIFSGCAKPSLP